MLCITIAHESKWINIVNGTALGASKHIDYALFHWKAADVKALKLPITKFIFIDPEGKVSEVIEAQQLKERGTNYKTAKRDPIELTEPEQEEVATAVELAAEFLRAAVIPKTKPTDKPAAEVPKIFLTPEAVAVGLKDFEQSKAKAEQAADDNSASTEGEADADAHAADHAGHEEAEEQQADDADQPEIPADTMKPSRKRKRR